MLTNGRPVRRGAGLAVGLSCLLLAACGSAATHQGAAAAAKDAAAAVPSSSVVTSSSPTSPTSPTLPTPAATGTSPTTPAAPKVLAAPSAPRSTTATSAAGSGGSLVGQVIVIDPGHNGGNGAHPSQVNRLVDAGFGLRKPCNTTGTATNAGYSEAAYTFDVAKRLAAVLRGRGATVVMTRTSNSGVGPCINQRAAIGNAAYADAVLSIHGDGNLAAGARGFHIIVAQRMTGGAAVQRASQRLADDVRAAFRSGTGMPYSTYTGGGRAETHRTDIGGLNLSNRPAVMIETGNMRSATDARLMTSPAWRQRAALALAAGLTAYLT